VSDLNGLLAAFETGELVRPSADALNLVDLGNCIAGLGGARGRAENAHTAAMAGLIRSPDHLVFVIADGLGMNVVNAMGGDSFIRGHVATELQSVFPTSTPVVLTSLATGQWPSAHAVPGWHVYLDEIDVVATIIQYVRRSDKKDLVELGLDSKHAFPVPSAVGDFDRDTATFLPKQIVDTPFSNYTSGGTQHQGYETLEDAAAAIGARISGASKPTMTQLYVPDVDYATHQFGTESLQVKAVLERLDGMLERLARELPDSARLVLTADHGLLDYDESHVFEIEPSYPLLEYLTHEPWGSGRVTSFQVREGRESEFEGAFRARAGELFYLLSVGETASLGLFGPGPFSPAMLRRLGTHIAVSKGVAVLDYLYPKAENKEDDFTPVSGHGGLTPAEMLVPLVVA
jgi:hypothetical protein